MASFGATREDLLRYKTLILSGIMAVPTNTDYFVVDGDLYYWSAGNWVQKPDVNNEVGGKVPLLVTPDQATAFQSLVSGAGNTLAVVGDSFIANGRNDVPGSLFERYPEGFLTWALALSRRRFQVISDQSRGNSYVSGGPTGTDFSVQLTTAIASGAKNLLLMGGINDVINNVPQATIKTAFSSLIATATQAGMRVWWCTQPCFDTAYVHHTVARQAQMLELADWIRQQCNTTLANRNVVCIDTAARLSDPASLTGDWYANTVKSDNLHPNNLGGYLLGKEVGRVWSLYVPEVPVLLASGADQYGVSALSNNVLDNGLFLSGTPTGTGFVQSVTGGASNTPSIVARADGFGNDQQQLAVFASNGDSVRLTTPDVKARLSVGDWITTSCELSVAGRTNYKGARLSLTTSATASFNSVDSQTVTTDVAITEDHTIVLQTLPYQITGSMGTIASVVGIVSLFGSGAGGVTAKIGRWSIRKLTALL